jgi:hypothetical protein
MEAPAAALSDSVAFWLAHQHRTFKPLRPSSGYLIRLDIRKIKAKIFELLENSHLCGYRL